MSPARLHDAHALPPDPARWSAGIAPLARTDNVARMPALVCHATDRRVPLGARCIVGRGPNAQIRLEDTTVSAEHASVYFDGGAWKVRDLGSRNGTFVNDRQLDVRCAQVLAAGDRLAFGDARRAPWSLESSLPPGPEARASRGRVLVGVAGTLWLPDDSEPEACVRRVAGRWLLESAEEARVVVDGEGVVIASQTYHLELPASPGDGLPAGESTVDAGRASQLCLRFSTSRDQEHVALEAMLNGEVVSLGARAHNFALLCLARRRLAERQSGIHESECGWFYAQELRETLAVDRVTLNLQLWRAVQVTSKLALPAGQLIERRLDSQQLRIGVADLDIEA